MNKLTTTVGALMLATALSAQFTVNVGVTGFNQDSANPINLAELNELGREYGVSNAGELPQHILDRADGTGQAINLGIGYDLALLNYYTQGNESQAGISANIDLYSQVNQTNAYEAVTGTANIGLYADFGLRIEAGIMTFHAEKPGWYLDLGARLVDHIYIYTRYQRASPFTSNIDGRFILDGSLSTLETLSAGVRFKF